MKIRVTEEEQAFYWSRVGTLLYLTKHSRLDIMNAVTELSKIMDGASKLQLRQLRRVAKFVLDTKNLGLCIVPTMNDGIWYLEALSGSDFANDEETRINVYGYIVFICVVPSVWKSKKYEKCGFVNHRTRICGSVRSGERNQLSVSSSDVHGN